MKEFDGDALRKVRLSKGYSLGMMSRLLALESGRQITRSAISHWERGKSRPSLENMLALSSLFQAPVDYFFSPLSNYLLVIATEQKQPDPQNNVINITK